MIPDCKRQTQTILYFLLGPEVNRKCLYGALCNEHALEKKEYYENYHNKEVRIEDIDNINKRVEESLKEQQQKEQSQKEENNGQ